MIEARDPVNRRAAKWVAALESGEHASCRGKLSAGEGLDALGVLAVAVFRARFRPRTRGGDVFEDARGCTAMLDYRRLAELALHEDATDAEVRRMRRIAHEHARASEVTDELLLKGAHRRGAARYHLVAHLSDAGVPHRRVAAFLRSSGWYHELPPKGKAPAPGPAPVGGRAA